MSYAYPSNPSSFRSSRRDPPTRDSASSNLLAQMQETVPPWLKQWIAELRARPRRRGDLKTVVWGLCRRGLTVVNLVVLLWVWVLWWGERRVFGETLGGCGWGDWEEWPSHATPHRVAFIADPQLVDPHTYPERPWPLSTLTVKYTDQYLRRSFSTIQRMLGPDSVVFLGDLFDGGREWGTDTTTSPEARFQKYTDSFWKKEYQRFSRVFSEQFQEGDAFSKSPFGRRMIASLPGNHDLGFGSGIQVPVRDRFQSFFGKGNRVDVLGNHTFVSVDTVSLSAMDQPDPNTGSTGGGSGDGGARPPNEDIWKEAEEFLNEMDVHRGKAEMHELRSLQGKEDERYQFRHEAVDIGHPAIENTPKPDVIGLPAILLTHVPLFRKAATPCGPYREHYPPSSNEELEEDEQNALKISGGYQYQNVLTQTISNNLVSKIGPNLVHVYSGDDHDYCEIAHREFSGSPREITVKSLSWAMGVRRPGFVLTSLWNPIDPVTGRSIENVTPSLQNHLCLLPDQLSVFIYYGLTLVLTLFFLLIHAFMAVIYPSTTTPDEPILPLSEDRLTSSPSPYYHPRHHQTPSFSTSSATTLIAPHGLASRAANTAATNPRHHSDDYYYHENGKDPVTDSLPFKGAAAAQRPGPGGGGGRGRGVAGEFVDSVRGVARVVVVWYLFLIWRW